MKKDFLFLEWFAMRAAARRPASVARGVPAACADFVLVSAPGKLRPGDDRPEHAAVRAGAPAGRKPRNTKPAREGERRAMVAALMKARESHAPDSDAMYEEARKLYLQAVELYYSDRSSAPKVGLLVDLVVLDQRGADVVGSGVEQRGLHLLQPPAGPSNGLARRRRAKEALWAAG